MRGTLLVATVCAVWAAACIEAPPPAAPPANATIGSFEIDVYPVLVRDCGFPSCHGSRDRFFRVFAPNRTRLDPLTPIDDPPTGAEVEASFERARSMLAGASSPESALLVRKPLAVRAGGAPHMGIDEHGRNVYESADDPRYQVLLSWASDAWGTM